LLLAKAEEARTVARLKGGDPFIFGRGGEEADVLHQNAIPFEIVPGVSSAVAAPAYAGIPLTDRRFSSSVAIITGHEDPTKKESRIHWDHLARGIDTLVFLMGVRNLEYITQTLIARGKDPKTPSALISWGTTPRQRTLTAALEEISVVADREGINPPAVLVIGEVVSLRESLAWFERSPLFGMRILVTRSREQASELSERLRALGAETLEYPTIQVQPPSDWSKIDGALSRIAGFDWIVFTSPNGVRFLLRRMCEKGGDIRDLKGTGIAAIGPGTALSLQSLGLRVDVMPAEYRAEALAEAFSGHELLGKKVLLPRALKAREVLPERLREMGASVEVAPVYETRLPDAQSSEIKDLLREGGIDLVSFTSSSTVTNFVEMIGKDRVRDLLRDVSVACIGPITAMTAKEEGIEPEIIAEEYTIAGLVKAIIAGSRRTSQSLPNRTPREQGTRSS
jgi:uroporphyrinogen III methyltransferase/synthase